MSKDIQSGILPNAVGRTKSATYLCFMFRPQFEGEVPVLNVYYSCPLLYNQA